MESRVIVFGQKGSQYDQLIVRFVRQENILHGTGIISGTVSFSVRIVLQGSIQVSKHIHALIALSLSTNFGLVRLLAVRVQKMKDMIIQDSSPTFVFVILGIPVTG